MAMLHEDVVQALERLVWEGEPLPAMTLEHVSECSACLQGLGLVCESVERGSSGWLEGLMSKLACGAIQGDLHEYVGLEPRQLARRHPAIALHFGVCGGC